MIKKTGSWIGNNCRSVALIGLFSLIISPAHAEVRDNQIDQARQCTMHFPQNERLYGIPTHLLAAIASTESGRWNDTLSMVIPWPWTINANGQGYYFDSKAEAVAKVKSLQRQGVKQIDVGCMQISLKHHSHAFSSVEQAFDPKYNVAYSAKFLRSNYDDLQSWTKATAAYHSRTPKFGNKYLGRIEKSWNGIVGKVREARSKRGLSSGQYASRIAAQEKQFAGLSREFARDSAIGGTHPVRNSKTVKVIEVQDEKRSAQEDTLVIRPKTVSHEKVSLKADKGAALQTVAAASSDMLVVQYNNSGKSASRSASVAKSASSKTSGPKFIFVE